MRTTFLTTLGAACAMLAAGRASALDCRVREASYRDPAWSCASARTLMERHFIASGSDPAARCVPASDFAEWGCLRLDTDARLCADGTYDMSVYLADSHVSLDCDGASIAPRGEPTGGSGRSGIRTPHSYSVEDIRIDHCQIVDSPAYGIDLKRLFRADEPCLQSSGPYTLTTKPGTSCAGGMSGHKNIRIQNTGISSPAQIGIYVGQASDHVTLSDLDIDGAGLGVYVEASSRDVHITRAVITNSRTREGIAIDSSHHNVVEDSLFSNNGAAPQAAINLYKNAGEFEGQVCPVVRPSGADHNIIRRNTFVDDDVNVASRESQDSYANCLKYSTCSLNYRDHAAYNVVVDNSFASGAQLDLLDSSFTVHGNEFASGAELEVGGKHHEYDLTGYVAHNEFAAGASVRLNASNFAALSVYNNTRSGACDPSLLGDTRNRCGAPNTMVWGETVLSAGLWVVVL